MIENQELVGELSKIIEIVPPKTQEKTTIPTKEEQVITYDEDYTGLSSVTIKPIPDEYIIPSGEIEITENGTVDVTNKASAKVNVKTEIDDYLSDELKSGGSYNCPAWKNTIIKPRDPLTINTSTSGYMFANYPYSTIPTLLNTNILTNMNNMFNYAQNLTSIPEMDTSKVTNMGNTFSSCRNITTIPELDTSSVTNMNLMFSSCVNLISIPKLNTSKVTSMNDMFSSCRNITTIPELDTSSVTNVIGMFSYCDKLTNLGGLLNLGQAYSTTASANYSYYTLSLSASPNLTHDSLMNVINGLYDIKTKGCNQQSLVLGSTNLAKLTSEEISSCTSKGWAVS